VNIEADKRVDRQSLAFEFNGSAFTMKDLLLLEIFKNMGVSERTMKLIEEDLKFNNVKSSSPKQ
jgi:hypothetical protein